MKKKYRYQVVFNENGVPFVIFTGETELAPENLLNRLRVYLSSARLDCELQSFVYEPFNPNQSCQEKEDPKATNE